MGDWASSSRGNPENAAGPPVRQRGKRMSDQNKFDAAELKLLHEAAVFMRLNNIQRHDAAGAMGKKQDQLDYYKAKAEKFEALELRLFKVVNPEAYEARMNPPKEEGDEPATQAITVDDVDVFEHGQSQDDA